MEHPSLKDVHNACKEIQAKLDSVPEDFCVNRSKQEIREMIKKKLRTVNYWHNLYKKDKDSDLANFYLFCYHNESGRLLALKWILGEEDGC